MKDRFFLLKSMSNDCVGLLAYSKCGRDRKRLFCVIDRLDEDFVLIADGNLHKTESPKKKRLKHLSFVSDMRISLPIGNGELYKCINEYELTLR